MIILLNDINLFLFLFLILQPLFLFLPLTQVVSFACHLLLARERVKDYFSSLVLTVSGTKNDNHLIQWEEYLQLFYLCTSYHSSCVYHSAFSLSPHCFFTYTFPFFILFFSFLGGRVPLPPGTSSSWKWVLWTSMRDLGSPQWLAKRMSAEG